LIRTQRRSLHRQLGKLSYALAPAVVLVTTAFVHQRMAGLAGFPELPAGALHSLALMLLSLVAFALFYGFAIAKRRDAQTHARWMVCTVFPMFTPVTDRLIAFNAPAVAGWLPRLEGSPVLPVFGFALADLILIALSWWDWRTHRRLNVFPVHVPPLRERREDIPELARHFATRFAAEEGKSFIRGFDAAAMNLLSHYNWPGNVRELSHVLERAVMLAKQDVLGTEDLLLKPTSEKLPLLPAALQDMTLEQIEKYLLSQTLQETGGNVSKSARQLGLSRMAMRYRMEKYSL